MFDRAGIDISMIQKADRPTGKVLETARRAGVGIVYLKMGFRADLSDIGASDSVSRVRHIDGIKGGQTMRSPDGRESRIPIRYNWGTDIVSALTPQANDVVLYTHRFSGFYETELNATLKRLKATSSRHGLHHECLRQVIHQRRDVPRLSAGVTRGLHGRANWRSLF